MRWQKWRFQVGFTPREGLVLYLVRYQDHGILRPLIYRASLAEMFIPYGDPSPAHYRKNVFDMGEYGIWVLANSLELGCDCLGEIYYFDACLTPAGTACRPGPRPTGRWKTPTWCSGTRSPPTTWCARRTGR